MIAYYSIENDDIYLWNYSLNQLFFREGDLNIARSKVDINLALVKGKIVRLGPL